MLSVSRPRTEDYQTISGILEGPYVTWISPVERKEPVLHKSIHAELVPSRFYFVANQTDKEKPLHWFDFTVKKLPH